MKTLLFFISFTLISCGFAPINNVSNESKDVFISFEDNLLNNKFIKNIERNSKFLNLSLTNSNEAEINIEILDHRISKYTGATDRNFFSATGVIEYEITMIINKSNKSKEFKEFNFSSSENFPYDTNKILSNEKKIEELETMFFFEAQNQLKNFLYLYFNG